MASVGGEEGTGGMGWSGDGKKKLAEVTALAVCARSIAVVEASAAAAAVAVAVAAVLAAV